jgi:hypothetical protein
VSTALGFLAALIVYPIAAWLVRLALTLLTMPLVKVDAFVRSRPSLGVLRFLVGLGCGAGGVASAMWLAASLGGAPAWVLGAALLALVGLVQLRGAWPFRGTAQFTDDMLSLVGEALGVAGVVAFVLVGSVTRPS